MLNQQSNKAKFGKYADNVYGISPDKLHPETIKLLDDPNYQSIILPAELDKKLADKESFFLYYFASTCPHCKATTPILSPLAKELGIEVRQYNLEEFKQGWSQYKLEFTPTLVYYKNGQEVERIVGEQTKDALQAFLTKHKS